MFHLLQKLSKNVIKYRFDILNTFFKLVVLQVIKVTDFINNAKNKAERCFLLLFPGSAKPLLQRRVFKILCSDWLVLFTMTKDFF